MHHNRSIYSFLDLLGDVGGLFDALKGIASFIITIYFGLFGDPINSYLLRKLFLQNPKEENDKEPLNRNSIKEKMQFLDRRKPFALPKILCILCRNKKQKRKIEAGLGRVEQELDIIKFLKSQMKIDIAIKTLFSKAERYLIKNNRKFVLNTSESDGSSSTNSNLDNGF